MTSLILINIEPRDIRRPLSTALIVNSYVDTTSKSNTAIRTDICPVELSMSNESLSSTSDHVFVFVFNSRVCSIVYCITEPSSTSLAVTGTGTRSPRGEFSSIERWPFSITGASD